MPPTTPSAGTIGTREGAVKQSATRRAFRAVDTPPLPPLPRCQATGYEVQPDPSTAKDWLKKPGAAVRRKDRMGISSVGSLRLVGVSGSVPVSPPDSAVATTNGLESQLLGSARRLSRPATVKLPSSSGWLIMQYEQLAGAQAHHRIGPTPIIHKFHLEHVGSKQFHYSPHLPTSEASSGNILCESHHAPQSNFSVHDVCSILNNIT